MSASFPPGSVAHLATIYDVKNCPRDDDGRLNDRGAIVDYPGEEPTRFFSCSVCGKWWTVVELKRLSQ